jgi:hypothetical protein
MQVLTKLLALACAIGLLVMAPLAHASPPSVPPAPRIEDSLTLTSTNLWDGLHNSKVTLMLRNGEQLSGKIVTQNDAELAIARSADGSVVVVPKREIEGVRLIATSTGGVDPRANLPPVAKRPTDDGRKLYGAGVALLTFGVPISVGGLVNLGVLTFYPQLWAPVLASGMGLLIGGSIALARSKVRLHAHRKAWGMPKPNKLALAPTLNLRREGGQVGLVLRF